MKQFDNPAFIISKSDDELDFLIAVEFKSLPQAQRIVKQSKQEYYEQIEHGDLLDDHVSNCLAEQGIINEVLDFEEVSYPICNDILFKSIEESGE